LEEKRKLNSRYSIRKVSLIVAVLFLLSITAAFAEIDVSQDIRSAIVGDMATGEIFYEYNSDETVELASITKLMTYLLAREAIDAGEVSFDDDVYISKNATNSGGSSLYLLSGESLKLEILMNSMLIVSGNDAAVAIAEHVSGNVSIFLEEMNEKANELGITTARFINPNGMPIDNEETDQNFMSAEDIFKLARYILKKYPDITQITSQLKVVIPERNFAKNASNKLLVELEGVDGLKTGYTDKAGMCLVSTIPYFDREDSNKDRRVIAVLMGTHSETDRTTKSKTMLEYGLYNYFIEKIINKDDIVEEIMVPNAFDMNLEVVAAEDYYKLVENGTTLRTENIYNEELKAPISKGDTVGKMEVYLNDEMIKEIPLKSTRDLEKAGFFTRVFRYLSNVLGV
jgi:D-alanyl-D-alanine carboxypeptidase (penicillin-binding protein 5/6)